jgi:hypothetical protein
MANDQIPCEVRSVGAGIAVVQVPARAVGPRPLEDRDEQRRDDQDARAHEPGCDTLAFGDDDRERPRPRRSLDTGAFA